MHVNDNWHTILASAPMEQIFLGPWQTNCDSREMLDAEVESVQHRGLLEVYIFYWRIHILLKRSLCWVMAQMEI